MVEAERELLSCSFCGKSQKTVKKLIAGPRVYICDECIDLCNDIITQELEPDPVPGLPDRVVSPARRTAARRQLADLEQRMSGVVDAFDDLVTELRRVVELTEGDQAEA